MTTIDSRKISEPMKKEVLKIFKRISYKKRTKRGN
jgi:hypothetical protein